MRPARPASRRGPRGRRRRRRWARISRTPPSSGRVTEARCVSESASDPQPGAAEEPGEHPDAAAGSAPSGWSLRSRRYRPSARPAKRLFTPDIKKLLKGWLVRRRDNPYPSRAEKESLAASTGLTHIQVCNWFANWRRKLRDCARSEDEEEEEEAGGEARGEASWAHLIRRYNALAASPNATTGQEHFSISSSDSIWAADQESEGESTSGTTTCGSTSGQQQDVSSTARACETLACLKRKPSASSEDGDDEGDPSWAALLKRPSAQRDDDQDRHQHPADSAGSAGPALLLSKWLESAARYQRRRGAASTPRSLRHEAPVGWGVAGVAGVASVASAAVEQALEGRHREELDAAEALTFLSSLHFR